jgi:hypothetical protein
VSFLSAAFLLALPLVLVPIAIHLYRGRQRDVVLWGAMHFLAAAVTKGRRMERLEELLLMFLRLAAVAALVLALAQPMVRSSWLGSDTERDVILVLDNSLSMSREVDGSSSIKQMKDKAGDIIDSVTSSDGVQVLLTAGSEWATAEMIPGDSNGKRQLHEIVERIEPTQAATNLLECLQEAIHLQPADRLSSRRIVVLTDSQAKSWQSDSAGLWKKLAADRDASEFPITITAIECGLETPTFDNLSVAAVQSAAHLVRPGETVEFTAEIENTGDVSSQASKVEWLLAGKVVEESALGALEPRSKDTVKASLKLAAAGKFAVACRLDRTDQLPLDQENSVVIEVADQLPVLFVDSEESPKRNVAGPALFGAALGFKEEEAQPWHSIFRPEVIQPSALATLPLTSYRAIVINNAADLNAATIERLDSFVRGGGGLWLAIGDKLDRKDFNREWYNDGDGLSPVELGVLDVIDKKDDAAATIRPPSRDHPATIQLANTTQLDIDEARVEQRWQLIEPKSTDKAVSILLQAGNGRPLVVEKFAGQGRVIVQAYPLDLAWSNLPLLKAYVVMIHDWLDYVTAPQIAHYNLSPGAPIVVSPPGDERMDSVTLINPLGREVPLASVDTEIGSGFRYSQTLLPGPYRVRFKGDGVTNAEIPFQVAREPGESDVRPLELAVRENLLASVGVQFGRDMASVPSTSQTAARREPVWGFLLAALVALLIAELVMAHWLARQRTGISLSTV